MAVCAIQNNSNQKSDKLSYFGSMIIGAVSGYSLKWALPITSQEKDERYNSELSKIRLNVKKARIEEIEAIRKEASTTPGADEFLHMYDNERLIYREIKKYNGSLSEKLMTLLTRVNDSAIKARTVGIQTVKSFTKSIRPTGGFIAIGAGIALGIALINNISKEASKS